MSVIHLTPKTPPTCPNHGCALEGCGFPLPAKGEGICPVSKAHFQFQVDGSESGMKPFKDAQGNITLAPSYKSIGEEN